VDIGNRISAQRIRIDFRFLMWGLYISLDNRQLIGF
jgi:hypothetical protein